MLRELEIPNRIALSPMCTYSCENLDGMASDWHSVHLASRGYGGVGLVVSEATAVQPNGRISPQDLGIWSDDHIPGLKAVTDAIRRSGARSCIQLAHAGRKAGTYRPWSKVRGLVPVEDGGWEDQVAPSALPFREDLAHPRAMSISEIEEAVQAFGDASRRAVEAGFDCIELHSAHGYLMHQFLSPISNHREDQYGGPFENRIRFHKQIVEVTRRQMPESMPLLIRLSATDWVEGGWTLEDSVNLAKTLHPMGVDFFDMSSGGSSLEAKVEYTPGFQVPFAEAIEHAGMKAGAVGGISEPAQANEIVASGKASLVLIGKQLLREPYWAYRAAEELGAPPPYANQYGWAIGN